MLSKFMIVMYCTTRLQETTNITSVNMVKGNSVANIQDVNEINGDEELW